MIHPQDRSLDHVIPPEILEDELHATILDLARSADINTVLEIGSSSGAGSTDAFVRGLRENPRHPRLFCMEVSEPRFNALAQRYAADSFVKCYRASSVSLDGFPTEQQVIDFWNSTTTALNDDPIDRVLGWLRDDIEYVRSENVSYDGIARIKRENQIDTFDLVLIDGSEFTGPAELREVYGAKFILLDDVNGYKNFHNYIRLVQDPNYRLAGENLVLRHGFAMFERVGTAAEVLPDVDAGVRRFVQRAVRDGMTTLDISNDGGRLAALLATRAGPSGRALSLPPAPGSAPFSLDDYCTAAGIPDIDLCRLDAGASLCDLLDRAAGLLQSARIGTLVFTISAALIQSAGRDARDIFSLLQRVGYRIYFLNPDGKIAIAAPCCTALGEQFIALSPRTSVSLDLFQNPAGPDHAIQIEGQTPTGAFLISFGPAL